MFGSKDSGRTIDLVPYPDERVVKIFEKTLAAAPNHKHLTAGGLLLDNSIFLEMLNETNLVNTTHMEVLISMLERSHATTLQKERASFVPPWYYNFIQGKPRQFMAAKRDKSKILNWSDQMKDFLCSPGKEWLEDIDTLYVPMIWKDEYWVGVVINLRMWFIEVIDPWYTLYHPRHAEAYIAPLVEMLHTLSSNSADWNCRNPMG